MSRDGKVPAELLEGMEPEEPMPREMMGSPELKRAREQRNVDPRT